MQTFNFMNLILNNVAHEIHIWSPPLLYRTKFPHTWNFLTEMFCYSGALWDSSKFMLNKQLGKRNLCSIRMQLDSPCEKKLHIGPHPLTL